MISKYKKFIVFAILFAGVIEAQAPVDKKTDDKFTISGSYNPFTVSTCSTTDRYVQGTVKMNYDKRFHKNWEFHSAAAYSRSSRISHEYHSDGNEEPPFTYKNSGYGDIGMSFWWDYLRVRGDFTLFTWDEYINYKKDRISVMPMGRGLIEAGKMDFMWVSTGYMHSEFPDGMLQVALSGNIKNTAIFGGGFVWSPRNITTWQTVDAPYSIFLYTKIKFDDNAALKSYINVKPTEYELAKMMFDFSLGFEFRF